MLPFASAFGIAAAGVTAVAFCFFVAELFRERAQPQRATWLIWAAISTLLLVSYFQSGARDSAWVPLIDFVGYGAIALLCIWRGKGGWGFTDRLCIAIAAVSIVLWIISGNPVVALVCNLVADFAGAWVTIKDPSGESKIVWGLFFTGFVLNLLAVDWHDFGIFVYPLYFFLAGGFVTYRVLTQQSAAETAV